MMPNGEEHAGMLIDCISFVIHTPEVLMPWKKWNLNRRGRTTEAREQGSTSVPSQAAPVASLSMQLLTPPPSSSNANERAGLSGSHSLLESNNVLITGGEFTQTHGHQANVVIHINHPTSESSSGSPPVFPSGVTPSNETDHISLAPSSGQSTQPRSQVSLQTQKTPLQRANDIYERHLILEGRGFPLWIPGPNQVLHIDYRRTGIRIGDVGIITHSGGFSFLFNICLPHNHPVNPRVLPEHFAPISPPIEATDVDEFLVFGNGSHIASASIKGLQTDMDISFESSASEGAILTMPKGARSEDLGNSAKFAEYAAANIADWYKFVNGPRGRQAKNGDVRLVVGFDKTTSWGMATFANQTTQNNCRLRFRSLGGAALTTSPSTYAWEYSGVAQVRAGPDSNQNDRLRMDTDPPDVQFENQCLFMRTLNITLADNFWADIHSSLGSVHVDSRNSQKYPPLKDYSSNHPHSNNLGTSSSSNFSSSQGEKTGTQRTASPLDGADVDVRLDDDPTMFISGPLLRIMVHPSKVLNDILLKTIPTAKMVITHDNDWSSFISQYDTLPDLHEVAMSILSSQNICEENGVIFLQPKEILNEMEGDYAAVNPGEEPDVMMADAETSEISSSNLVQHMHTTIGAAYRLLSNSHMNKSLVRIRKFIPRLIGLEEISPCDEVILVMGPAGAGKSTFINTAAEQMLLEVGHGLEPCTTKVAHVRCTIDFENSSKQVVFVDTPAFPGDDGMLTEQSVGKEIQKWSEKTFGKKVNITGIIYLYNINDNRMVQPPHLLFQKLCGSDFHSRVLLVTTMWEKLRKQEDGEKRMAKIESHWSRTTNKQVVRYYGTKESVWDVVKALVG